MFCTPYLILDNIRAQYVGELQEDLCKALCISYPPILCESYVSQKRALRMVFVRLSVCPVLKINANSYCTIRYKVELV